MRLTVVCDLHEEEWPSMDLVADELVAHARVPGVSLDVIRPSIPGAVRRWLFGTSGRRLRRHAGLAGLRYGYYPALLRTATARADWFHIADHSYAHLARSLPAGRVGVYCHDVDAFRALWQRESSGLARLLAAHGLRGLRQARVVFYSTVAVREEIEAHRLVPSARLVHAPYGVADEFRAVPSDQDRKAAALGPYVLHVGSLIPRKNPAFLLKMLEALRNVAPTLKLVQIGGEWAPSDRAWFTQAGLDEAIVQRRGLTRSELAACYRNAAAVVLPSLREGFGLPIVEALACGAPVVASDLPVLRQVGADAVAYAPVGELSAWVSTVTAVMNGRGPARTRRLELAAGYTWARHAATILEAYQSLSDPG